MNKYLKILMLSGGLVGAIAPTAIDINNDKHSDLGSIYEQVEKMQQAIPRLSRINYKLNIDLGIDENGVDDIDENNDITNNTVIDEDTNIISDNIKNNTTDNSSTSDNITFTTTDENGNESTLNNEETINYLNQTLNQTNIEYEQLKNTLNNAIKDTMDYLDAYKSGEQTLTNEQKIYIREHSNSIKFLAETLEDLSEEVICCIDGCEDCEDSEQFEATASKYLATINDLETRINVLNNAIASLQLINNIGNPHFFAGKFGPNHMFYGYHNFNENHIDNNDNTGENDQSVEVDDNNDDLVDNSTDSVDNIEDTQDNEQNQDSVENVENNDTISANTEDDKPTTFGLKSNIDTYAPTKRNIDTFFNTALYNNEYMNGYGNYGYGYGNPYGGYGYGMPYGSGVGNPYGNNGLNSNIVNRQVVENQQNQINNMANIDNQVDNSEDVKKPKKIRVKRAKNIDTYSEITVQSNINTMGESKISRFFKEKFNNLRNKVRKQKQDVEQNKENQQNDTNQPIIEKNNNLADIKNNDIISEVEVIDNQNIDNKTNNSESPITQEKEIKAK